MEEKLMTSDEVAEYLGITKRFVYKLIQRGQLKCYRVGNKKDIRISRDQVKEYLSSVEESHE